MSRRVYNAKRPDVASALVHGWSFSRVNGSGHLIFDHPGTSKHLTLPSTTKGPRAIANGIAQVRRLTPFSPSQEEEESR